jgi:hypothetical protein
MEANVRLDNHQINAILDASYALTNKMGMWFDGPPSEADALVLQALSLVEKELRALFDACPDMGGRPHNVEEIQRVVYAAMELMSKLATSFPSIDRIPEVIRNEIKSLYFALSGAGLIDISGQ